MPPTRDAEQRVTAALQRAHHRAQLEAESTARALEAATADHARALDAHSEALHDAAALAGALAERGAPTLAEESRAMREATRAALAAQLAGLDATPARVVMWEAARELLHLDRPRTDRDDRRR